MECVWRAGFENTPRAPRMESDIRPPHPGVDGMGIRGYSTSDYLIRGADSPANHAKPDTPLLSGDGPKTNTALREVTSEHRSKLGLPAVALWHAGVDHGARLVTLPGPAGTHPNPPSHARGPAAA